MATYVRGSDRLLCIDVYIGKAVVDLGWGAVFFNKQKVSYRLLYELVEKIFQAMYRFSERYFSKSYFF